MLQISHLPEVTIFAGDASQRLELSQSAEKIQWLSNLIVENFPTERRLGLNFPTGPHLILVWLAVLKAGKEPCLLHSPTEKISKDYWRESVRHTMANCGLEGLIHGPTLLPYKPELLAKSLLIPDQIGESPCPDDVIPDGAVIQLSSGTTGHKKGVRLTTGQLRRHVENYNQVICLGANDVIVSWLPLYHDMGFIACFVTPLLLNIPVVMIDPITWVKQPDTLFQAIAQHRGTICYMPNFGFEVMARQPATASLATMRQWISCSEPTYHPTLDQFCRKQGVPSSSVSTCYAMAENVFAVTQSSGMKTTVHSGETLVSCGPVIPGTQIKLVGEEIYVRSDTSLSGYVGTGDVRDTEGFYATGDLGMIIDGELYISGRKRDVMISGGRKYFLNDLDFAAGKIMPASAGRIAALAERNEHLGTETVTFLVERCNFWDTADRKVTVEALREITDLETFEVHFVPPAFITKTSSGKINRKKTLEDWHAFQEAKSLQPAPAAGRDDQAALMAGKIEQSFPALSRDRPLGSELDSLGSVLMRLICETHGVDYSPEASVNELVRQIECPAPTKQEKVFSIVTLVDGVKLGFGSKNSFITPDFIARVSRAVGVPVRVEHVAVPPAPILFSDLIFHDYFMPRDAGEKYGPFSAIVGKIKDASLILIDDEDAFRLRDFCVYPRLSHRFNADPKADLLGHRLQSYTLNHHLLPREVVAGRDIDPARVTESMEQMAAYLGVPVMKLAFHQQFQAFTKHWDYTQYRPYVSDADYQKNPVRADEIQQAIVEYIQARRATLHFTQGAAGTRQLVLKDPPHFCSFLLNERAVDHVVTTYDSFCIAGLPSSLPYLEQQLKVTGKPYFYSTSLNPERTDYACMVCTGFSGAAPQTTPYYDFVHIGDEGGRPHNVPAEVERACPSLAVADQDLTDAYRKSCNNLVPIGNYLLNYREKLRQHFFPTEVAARTPADGTIIVFGPVYARSGFGLLARSCALALHETGRKVRVIPVDCDDPKMIGELDDCNVYLLRSLEHTEIQTPVTAIYAYVPIYHWPRMKLPEPNVRIMLTTYDSSAQAKSPPYRLIYICNQMDQIWVPNETEQQAWIQGGAKPEILRVLKHPSDWIDNPILGAPRKPETRPGRVFRFLHVSQFLPRRRLDVLIEAFHCEFRQEFDAELYLKVTYPSWHPKQDQPRQDLRELISSSQAKSGSKAKVIIDEKMGTRKELARLYDSCDIYVSPDTTSTAPVTEAIVRGRLAIITEGWNVDLPPQLIVMKNSAERVKITPAMEFYMPHHRGGSFPALELDTMRAALRTAYAMPQEERHERAISAFAFMRDRFSFAATAPANLAAIDEAWSYHQSVKAGSPTFSTPTTIPDRATALVLPAISWCGLQLFHGKIPAINRNVCFELLQRGHHLSLQPSNGPFHVDELPLETREKYQKLADRFFVPAPDNTAVTVSNRWHPIFKEQPAARQVMVSTWWSGATPDEWRRKIDDYVNEVWVPSRHVRDNFIQGGVAPEKLWIMPMGVETDLFRPEAAPLILKTKKRFRFLFVGETSQRKGIDLLLRAYASAFSSRDDVCLVIKDMDCEDYYGRRLSAKVIRHFQSLLGNPEVEYLEAMMPEEEMPSLYTACHCFVQPFRSSSFNLAALEAMACGLPVITTDYAGAREICHSENSYLVNAREIFRRQDLVGHWRISGQQRHAEINGSELVETMRHIISHPEEAAAKGRAGRKQACENFGVASQADRIEQRLAHVAQTQPTTTGRSISVKSPVSAMPAPNRTDAMQWLGLKEWAGSVLVVAPFYNRSGYATAARAVVAGLTAAGIAVRIASVDNVEEGIDDCDLAALKALEQTPIQLPLAALFIHIPHQKWLDLPLPKESVRILYTTFDSSAQGNKPPPAWVKICAGMDQVWVMTEKESAVFASTGLLAEKIKVLYCPHPWINNSVLPLPKFSDQVTPRFRFLSMAMFLPRRRWDTLIEAFLSEFASDESVELYLKVNYPSWHPVAGKPQRDLRELIETLREKTKSRAMITIDEELGTRQSVCAIVDACDVYVSTDTAATAPLSEAFVRGRPAIFPDGYGAKLPYTDSSIVIPVDPGLKAALTPEMVLYQPHHRGMEMPLLRVDDVRRALREAFLIPCTRRAAMGQSASLFMESYFSATVTTPPMIRAIREAFECKQLVPPKSSGGKLTSLPVAVNWNGAFFNYGSLAFVNRELTKHLCGQNQTITLNRESSETKTGLSHLPLELRDLAKQFSAPSQKPAVTVRHQWPPDWSRPKQGALIVMQPWEFGMLPQEWVRRASDVDEFWAYTNHVRQVYISSGVDTNKVKVVPLGIDPTVFRPDAKPLPLATTKRFKFLFVGGTITRKGPDILLKAYLDNFSAADDVCLVIKDFGGKSVYAGQTLESSIKAAQALPASPEILYLNEELPPDALPALYTACDSLVHPYRGEGFGLPILEAMACGLPVIVTAGGSADDFATDEFAYRIPAIKRSIGDTVSGMKLAGEGWMLEPDVIALGQRMKWVVAHREEARATGLRASDHVRHQWTWERAALVAAERLTAVAAQYGLNRSAKKTPAMVHKSVPIIPPPVAKLGDLTKAQDLLRKKSPRAAWDLTREAILARPHHPEGFLLLAEIARLVGDSGSARRCAEHAQLLAPAFKPARKFLKGNFHGTTKSDWLKLPPPLEGPRENSTPRVSVCLIVKDEEKFIGQCLASIKDLAYQIVVVDTGSTDQTIAIAKQYGAEIHSFAWCQDFSAARNAALQHATGDWILALDADEELPVKNHPAFRRLLEDDSVISWRLPIIDVGHEGEGNNFVPRLFRNAPGIYFIGRIHEQIFSSVEARRIEWGLANRIGDAALLHHGYTKELIEERGKVARNLLLLEKAVTEITNDPLLFMNYGLELCRSQRIDEGLQQYHIAFELMSQQPVSSVTPETREALLTQYATHLRIAKRPAEVWPILNSPLAKSADLTASQHFLLGLAHMELQEFSAAAQQMRHCLAKRDALGFTPINPDIRTALPRHSIALCLWHAKDIGGTEEAFQAAMAEAPTSVKVLVDFTRFLQEQDKIPEALQALHQFTSANPTVADAWIAGGKIALTQPNLLEVALDWTDVAIKLHPENEIILNQRAEALMLCGHLPDALSHWKKCDSGSNNPRRLAAIALCEAGQCLDLTRLPASLIDAIDAELVRWYWRLVEFGAERVVLQLNESITAFESTLPGTAKLLHSVVVKLSITETA